MTQYTYPTDKAASGMMWDTGRRGAGDTAHCSCGIDHYVEACDDVGNSTENIEYIHYIELDGNLFVDNCDGCSEKLLRYENFIWNNRNHIRDYLKTRVNQEKRWADQEHLLNTLAEI